VNQGEIKTPRVKRSHLFRGDSLNGNEETYVPSPSKIKVLFDVIRRQNKSIRRNPWQVILHLQSCYKSGEPGKPGKVREVENAQGKPGKVRENCPVTRIFFEMQEMSPTVF